VVLLFTGEPGARGPVSENVTIRVFLCDDVPEFRALVRFSFEEDARLEVVGEACDGIACVSGVSDVQPDVVLLDLSMPRCDGLEVIPLVRQVAPGCAVIVLSGFSASRLAPQVMAAGAHAYLEKGESFAVIQRAVHEVAGREGPAPV